MTEAGQQQADDQSTDEVTTATAAVLKALAHPLRQQIFRALSSRGYARAADLAEALGKPANQISFHLRVLADADIIEEAPEYARDRRDRVWRMKSRSMQIGSPEHPVVDEALGGAVLQWVAADLHSIIQRLVMWAPEYAAGRTSEVHGTMTSSSLWLTEEDFKQMIEELGEVLTRYKDMREHDDLGARRWQFGVIAADDEI